MNPKLYLSKVMAQIGEMCSGQPIQVENLGREHSFALSSRLEQVAEEARPVNRSIVAKKAAAGELPVQDYTDSMIKYSRTGYSTPW